MKMLIIWSNAFVADTGFVNIEHVTSPLSANVLFACRQWAQAHPIRFTEMRHDLSSGGGRHHFFEFIFFSIASSSICSAS